MSEGVAAFEGKASSSHWAVFWQGCLSQWLRKRMLRYAPPHVSTESRQTSAHIVKRETRNKNPHGDVGK